ncbi:hypothetical protein ACVWZD_003452 [Streptomyces sp. TE3672]
MARDFGTGPVVVAEFGDGGAGAADAALDWLEHELPNLMSVLRIARAAGIPALG